MPIFPHMPGPQVPPTVANPLGIGPAAPPFLQRFSQSVGNAISPGTVSAPVVGGGAVGRTTVVPVPRSPAVPRAPTTALPEAVPVRFLPYPTRGAASFRRPGDFGAGLLSGGAQPGRPASAFRESFNLELPAEVTHSVAPPGRGGQVLGALTRVVGPAVAFAGPYGLIAGFSWEGGQEAAFRQQGYTGPVPSAEQYAAEAIRASGLGPAAGAVTPYLGAGQAAQHYALYARPPGAPPAPLANLGAGYRPWGGPVAEQLAAVPPGRQLVGTANYPILARPPAGAGGAGAGGDWTEPGPARGPIYAFPVLGGPPRPPAGYIDVFPAPPGQRPVQGHPGGLTVGFIPVTPGPSGLFGMVAPIPVGSGQSTQSRRPTGGYYLPPISPYAPGAAGRYRIVP